MFYLSGTFLSRSSLESSEFSRAKTVCLRGRENDGEVNLKASLEGVQGQEKVTGETPPDGAEDVA